MDMADESSPNDGDALMQDCDRDADAVLDADEEASIEGNKQELVEIQATGECVEAVAPEGQEEARENADEGPEPTLLEQEPAERRDQADGGDKHSEAQQEHDDPEQQ